MSTTTINFLKDHLYSYNSNLQILSGIYEQGFYIAIMIEDHYDRRVVNISSIHCKIFSKVLCPYLVSRPIPV